MDEEIRNEIQENTAEQPETAEVSAQPEVAAEQPAEPAQPGTAAEPVQSAEETPAKEKKSLSVSTAFFEAASVVVTSIAIIAIIFTFAFRLIGVDGPSMQDTLQDGDWVIVTPYYSEPVRGDIVICTQKTAARGPIVKRVIGLAGDIVEVDEYDRVIVNGEYLEEDSYVRNDGEEWRHGNLTYPITVPDGCVMLMGDHRSVSWDSRYSEIGFIDVDELLGKVQIRLSKDWNVYSNYNK